MHKLVLALTLALAAPAGVLQPTALSCTARPAPIGSLPANRPLVSLWGAHSQIEERSVQRVTAEPEWTALYLRHLGRDPSQHSEYYNVAGIPEVNFERCMVVAVFQGAAWNSAGVNVVALEENSERLQLRFDDRSYQTLGPDGGGQQVTAFGFFVLPRSDKPLVVEEDVQNEIGQAPKWKERARFEALPGH